MKKAIKELCFILQFLFTVVVGAICLSLLVVALIGFPICYFSGKENFNFFYMSDIGMLTLYAIVLFLFLLYFAFCFLKSAVMFLINSWKKSGEQYE